MIHADQIHFVNTKQCRHTDLALAAFPAVRGVGGAIPVGAVPLVCCANTAGACARILFVLHTKNTLWLIGLLLVPCWFLGSLVP